MFSGRFTPDSVHTYNDNPRYLFDQRRLAALIGLVAFGLPLLLLAGTMAGACFYISISHYYYTQFLGGVFVALLAFIGTFLIAYRGECSGDNWLATYAGLSAFGIAIFPTDGQGCEEPSFSGRAFVDFVNDPQSGTANIVPSADSTSYFELIPFAGEIHLASAAFFFGFLAYYSLFVFTRIIDEHHRTEKGRLRLAKFLRNSLYYLSGIIILGAMGAIIGNSVYEAIMGQPNPIWDAMNLTFYMEAIALWAFALSWIVRGRFFGLTLLFDDRDYVNKKRPA